MVSAGACCTRYPGCGQKACKKPITIFSSNNSTAIGKVRHIFLTTPHCPPRHRAGGRQEAGKRQAGGTPAPHARCLQAEPPQTRAGSFGFKPAPASSQLKQRDSDGGTWTERHLLAAWALGAADLPLALLPMLAATFEEK